MSFYVRKSVNFGPIRFNISKSGIGISAGVRGARISTGPVGTYVHLGAGGVYYRKQLDGSIEEVAANRQLESRAEETIPTTVGAAVEQINARLAQPTLAWIVPLAATVIAGLLGIAGIFVAAFADIITQGRLPGIAPLLLLPIWTVAFLGWLGSFWIAWVTFQQERLARTTTLHYQFDGISLARLKEVGKGLLALSSTRRLYRVRALTDTRDSRRNAGLASEIDRDKAFMRIRMPPYLHVGFPVYELNVSNAKIYFLPDQLFVLQQGRYGTIPYNKLALRLSTFDVTEKQGGAPEDAEVVGWKWLYSNTNGTPDQRFNNNRQVPTVRYACITLAVGNQFSVDLHVSSQRSAQCFVTELRRFGGQKDEGPTEQETKGGHSGERRHGKG